METNSPNLPELIEWHEGLLLTPQHFQQLAARGELLTHFMFTQATPFGWGVIDLKIDEAALGGGVLRLLNVEAILPDGVLVAGGSERGFELAFDLSKADQNPVRIYLAIPREAAIYNRTDQSRYEAVPGDEELSPDGVSGAEPVSIPRVRSRLRLIAGRSGLAGMTSIPLIEFRAEGTVLKETQYVPPLLRLRAGSTVAGACARLRKSIRETATSVAGKMRPEAGRVGAVTPHQLQWLVAGLPTFEALLETEQVPPYSLYLALTSIAGGVAFLSNAKVPPIFRPYDHNELYASFEQVIGFIRLALSEGLIENWIGAEFVPVPGRGYEIAPSLKKELGEDADFSLPYFGLALRLPPSVAPESMTEWGESCLLASEDKIADLELSRSRGAVCERVDFIEDLVAPPGSVLFRVKNDAKWLDPVKKLVLKPAKQETLLPDTLTLFLKRRAAPGKDG